MNRPRSLKATSKPDDIELPESAQVVADVIGRKATLTLTKLVKHRKMYVPKTLCAGHDRMGHRLAGVVRRSCTCKGHWIAKAIGDELAVKLVRVFGGESVDLAPCYYVHSVARNEEIRQKLKAGATALDMMREYDMSLRAIRYISAGITGRPDKSSSNQGKRDHATH